MAKTTTSSQYKQTTKGNKSEAGKHAKQAGILGELAKINRRKLGNLHGQYKSSTRDIEAKLQRDLALLKESHAAAGANYARQGADNDAAESDTSFANLANMRRERTQSLAQVAAQGGGETDMLKAQGAALRNWSQNQGQANRSYADTLSSINTSISDTNMSNKVNFQNTGEQADADTRAAFNQWKEAQGQVFNEQANIYGQQSELYGTASTAAADQYSYNKTKETSRGKKNFKNTTTSTQGGHQKNTKLSKSYEKLQDQANSNLLQNARELANLNAEVYQSNVRSADQLGFTANDSLAQKQNMNQLGTAQKLTKISGVEGATLRKW